MPDKTRSIIRSFAGALSRLCKIARTLIDGGDLPDPPERPPKGKGGGKDGGKEDGERGERSSTSYWIAQPGKSHFVSSVSCKAETATVGTAIMIVTVAGTATVP